jgi:hypothetical protein
LTRPSTTLLSSTTLSTTRTTTSSTTVFYEIITCFQGISARDDIVQCPNGLICTLDYIFQEVCSVPVETEICKPPCETVHCEYEVFTEIDCPVWSCDSTTTTTTTSTTTPGIQFF